MTRRLFLVAGGAGTGKSTAARLLAQRLDGSWLQLDSLWIAMRSVAREGSSLKDLLDIDARLRRAGEPVSALVSAHVQASEAVCAALPEALAYELDAQPVVVADGAWILPAWAAALTLPHVEVTTVVLHEPDHDHLREAMRSRRGGPPETWHETSEQVASAYGAWLVEQASVLGLPVVQSRPWPTLVARILVAIDT